MSSLDLGRHNKPNPVKINCVKFARAVTLKKVVLVASFSSCLYLLTVADQVVPLSHF